LQRAGPLSLDKGIAVVKKLSSRLGLATASLTNCTVILLSLSTHADASSLAKGAGPWDYVLRRDAEGLPLAAFARLRGDNGSLLWLTCQRQILDSDRPAVPLVTAAVVQKQYLGRSDSRGRSTVYWFDEGAPEVGHWVYRDRHGQIPQPNEVYAFVDRLGGAQRLTVELSNYRFETRKLEFLLDAGDSRSVADRFRKDCRDIFQETGE
jgi:hypothetical protein